MEKFRKEGRTKLIIHASFDFWSGIVLILCQNIRNRNALNFKHEFLEATDAIMNKHHIEDCLDIEDDGKNKQFHEGSVKYTEKFEDKKLLTMKI